MTMDILWIFHGYFMDILWIFHGYFMDRKTTISSSLILRERSKEHRCESSLPIYTGTLL